MILSGTPFLLLLCLWTLMSAIPSSSANLNTTNTSSLWGKKLKFDGRACTWQLRPELEIPALNELSVCVFLRRNYSTEWRAFVYKNPKQPWIELGLGGTGAQITVWMFGRQWRVLKWLRLNEWYSLCLTWSSQKRRLRVYVNGMIHMESPLSLTLPTQLAKNGTLTLGVSHSVLPSGEVSPEGGSGLFGEIGLFRMWRTEWGAEELRRLGCADGDVVSWDLRQWKHNCPPVTDHDLQCVWPRYKIKLWASITNTRSQRSCSMSLEETTRNWLKSILPPTVSVRDISVSFASRTCPKDKASEDQHAQQRQHLNESSYFSCDKCFRSEISVQVDPSARVEVVQSVITQSLLSSISDYFVHLKVDPNHITVLPVEFLEETEKSSTTSHAPTKSVSTSSLPPQHGTVSTTEEPNINTTFEVQADQFFKVHLSLNLSCNLAHPEDVIKNWVKKQLEWTRIMIVLNFVMKDNTTSTARCSGSNNFHQQREEYHCAFHVQEYGMGNVEVTMAFIHDVLMFTSINESMIIQPGSVNVTHIMPKNCPEEPTPTIYGLYFWAETFPQVNQEMGCFKPMSERAFRLCKLHIENDTTSWSAPDMSNCEPVVTISDIGNITVTPENFAEVVDIIHDLVTSHLANVTYLPSAVLETVIGKLIEVVRVGIIKPQIAAKIVSVVASVLLSDSDVTSFSDSVLDLTESMGNTMAFEGESATVTAPFLALSMVDVDPDEFFGLTFGASLSTTLSPEVFVNQSFVSEPPLETNASISLPSEINNFFPIGEKNTTRVQFQFYATRNLFQDPEIANSTDKSLILNSFVVSASINNTYVMNLKEPVVVTLNHQIPKQPENKVQCVFWDFNRNDGQGGWNSSGCESQRSSSLQTTCFCNHLTHFAILLDVSRGAVAETDYEVLTIISYVGCGVSAFFLGITLLTYLMFEKLRQDYPSKILINLSAALLGLSMIFLLNSWLSSFSNYGLCIATGAFLHYFLLASFTWMGLEALHMYFALVKVFNTYVPFYILKFCAAGWGTPLLVVGLVLAIDKDAYGSYMSEEGVMGVQSTQSCWLKNDVFFYVTVVAFIVLVLLCNLTVFAVVLIQIRKMGASKISTKSRSSLQDFRAVASLTVLLGLNWGVGFFSVGPARVIMMYIFAITNSLQGLFVFLFHCLLKENVRKQWRRRLCFGRFKLTDNSGWSQSGTADGSKGKKNLVSSDTVETDKSSSLKSLTPPS